jgi:hypothetical protein
LAFIQNLFSSRDNNADSANNVGQQGRLWWDPITNRFYASDGVTPGGIPVGGSGNVTTDRLINGNYQLVLNSSGEVTAPGSLVAAGNISANYFVGNGSQLTAITGANVTGQVGNALVATLAVVAGTVSANAQPNITSVGTLTQITVTGNVTGGNLITAGITTSTGNIVTGANAVVSGYVTATGNITGGNINSAGLISVTGNLVGGNVTAAGMVSAIGNITGNYILGNGSQLTGLPATYGNANVAAYLPTYTGNLVALTGNVTTTANVAGSYFLGNGSQLTGLPATYGNANVAAYLPTYTGNLAALAGNVTTTANVAGSYFLGNGSQLIGLPTGGAITVLNQGNVLTTTANSLNFIGSGVSSSATGNSVTVDIYGASNFLPPQAGNVGNVLSTNGTNTLWQNMPGAFGLVIDGGNAVYVSPYIIDGGFAI